MLQQDAAQHRPQRDGTAHSTGPHADGATALVRREHHGDDCQRHRQHRGAADAHDAAERDQGTRGGGECASGGGEPKMLRPSIKTRLRPYFVAQHAPGEQQRGEHQDVGIDRPYQLALRGVEDPSGSLATRC